MSSKCAKKRSLPRILSEEHRQHCAGRKGGHQRITLLTTLSLVNVFRTPPHPPISTPKVGRGTFFRMEGLPNQPPQSGVLGALQPLTQDQTRSSANGQHCRFRISLCEYSEGTGDAFALHESKERTRRRCCGDDHVTTDGALASPTTIPQTSPSSLRSAINRPCLITSMMEISTSALANCSAAKNNKCPSHRGLLREEHLVSKLDPLPKRTP